MEETRDELAAVLDRLMQEVVIGKAHLKIWEGLAKALSETPQLADVARTFFGLTLQAHIEQAFLHAARLYDSKRGAVTARSLLTLAERKAGKFQNARPGKVREIISRARQQLGAVEPLLDAVQTRRNKMLAHLDPQTIFDPSKVAKSSQTTIKKMEKMFDAAGNVVNEISGSYRGSTSVLDLFDTSDFENMLTVIKRGKRAQFEEYEKEFGRPWSKDTSWTKK